MAGLYYQKFEVTGVASSTASDAGLESTEEERRHIDSVLLWVSGWAGNVVEIWLERELLAEIMDYHCQTDESSGSTNTQKDGGRELKFELGHDLPAGKTLKAKIRCGATNKNLKGSYVYRKIGA